MTQPKLNDSSIALVVLPTLASALSMVASCTIVIMILRSTTKLTKPYRRIVFGMSIYDIIQSLALIASVFPSPRGSTTWAIGNDATCSAQGFILQVGFIGSPFYSVSLAIFYYCVIKLHMKDAKFTQKVEPYLHLFTIIFSWASAIFLVSVGAFNNNGYGCYIAPYPEGCLHDPNEECIRGQRAFLYRYIFYGAPIFLSLVVSASILIMVIRAVKLQNIQNDRYRSELWRVGVQPTSASRRRNDNNSRAENTSSRIQRILSAFFTTQDSRSNEEGEGEGEADGQRLSSRRRSSRNTRSRAASVRRVKDVQQQALIFIIAFTSTKLFASVNRVLEHFLGSTPIGLHVIAKTLLALNGLVNILVYTRPHVTSLRRKHGESYSWLKAFFVVVKKGGDSDKIFTRRNSSVIRRDSTRARRSSRLSLASAPGSISTAVATYSPRNLIYQEGHSIESISSRPTCDDDPPLNSKSQIWNKDTISINDNKNNDIDDDNINDEDMENIMKTVAFLNTDVTAQDDEV